MSKRGLKSFDVRAAIAAAALCALPPAPAVSLENAGTALPVDDTLAVSNPYAEAEAAPPHVAAGTVISATVTTGLNSDLPGNVVAEVTEDVFDADTGAHLLIPRGARFIGSSYSVVADGQNQVLLVWQRIVMPDATSIAVERRAAPDTTAYAALQDKVDVLTWQLLRSVALSTLLGADGESDHTGIVAIRPGMPLRIGVHTPLTLTPFKG